MNDTVLFQGMTYNLPTGHDEAEVRAALSEQAPAIMHASLTKTQNPNGTFTWDFAERAGTKG